MIVKYTSPKLSYLIDSVRGGLNYKALIIRTRTSILFRRQGIPNGLKNKPSLPECMDEDRSQNEQVGATNWNFDVSSGWVDFPSVPNTVSGTSLRRRRSGNAHSFPGQVRKHGPENVVHKYRRRINNTCRPPREGGGEQEPRRNIGGDGYIKHTGRNLFARDVTDGTCAGNILQNSKNHHKI